MFTPLPMRHVTLQALTTDLPAAALILARLGIFNPDHRPEKDDSLPDIPGQQYRQLHQQAQSRLEKLAAYIPVGSLLTDEDSQPISEKQLTETNQWLGEAWQVCSEHEEERRSVEDELREIDQLESTLTNFRQLNLDLGLLQEQRRFLDIHIGIVPQQHVRQLRDAVGLDGYLMFDYMESHPNAHLVIIGPVGSQSAHLHSVLDTAGYRELTIPSELHSKPDQAAQNLQTRRESAITQLQGISERFQNWCQSNTPQLQDAAKILQLAAPYVAMGEAAHQRGNLSQIHGWVPEPDVPLLEQALQEKLDNPFVLNSRIPEPEEHRMVPTVLRPNRLLRPFTILVTQYGVPRYGELNPSSLFALTFILMFGMMFGDVGHGAVIFFTAWLARKRLRSFTLFALLAGISSMIFGLLYGSLFGYEHLLPAVWMSPLADPLYMLTIALIWGIGFISLNSLLNIINQLLQDNPAGALFTQNGVVSLLLYAGLIGIGFNYFQPDKAHPFWPYLATIALVSLFGYQLLAQKAPLAERFLVALIETYETVIGYISNTLSFLRVAAFSLNHVALAIAVFTLAEGMGETGHWLMVLFGNLFILILEGAIVTIQVLRLEYYEGFSRFYAGDGQAFRPLKL